MLVTRARGQENTCKYQVLLRNPPPCIRLLLIVTAAGLYSAINSRERATLSQRHIFSD